MEELEKQDQEVQGTTEQSGVTETTDPMEELKQKAQELGATVLTQKELQSLIDREITRAIKSREENLKKEQEKKLLEEQGRYEELLKLERKEALEKLKREYLEARGLNELNGFIDVSSLASKSITEATEELTQVLASLESVIGQMVEKRLKEMQRTTVKPTKQEEINDIRQALIERLRFG